jgi:hypothetical protein
MNGSDFEIEVRVGEMMLARAADLDALLFAWGLLDRAVQVRCVKAKDARKDEIKLERAT